jgi:hypothetical protein
VGIVVPIVAIVSLFCRCNTILLYSHIWRSRNPAQVNSKGRIIPFSASSTSPPLFYVVCTFVLIVVFVRIVFIVSAASASTSTLS